MIAASLLQIDLSCVLEQVITELTAFLRKVREFITYSCALRFQFIFVLYQSIMLFVQTLSKNFTQFSELHYSWTIG